MTIKEALIEIKSRPKWYQILNEDGSVNVSTMIYTAQRIEDGRCKPETIRSFFERFGYEYKFEEKIEKI